mgnify:CR=1 FL=1
MATIVIRLEGQPAGHGPLTHQFRNFGEDVFRQVRGNEWGEVNVGEVDRSTNMFSIANVNASTCRRVVRWVEKEAVRQFLTVTTEVH